MRCILLTCVLVIGAGSWAPADDHPAWRPRLVQASDRASVEAAMDQDVFVEGVVKSAEWSRTGKVMNIEFDGAEGGLLAVVFERTREAMDAGFGGDLSTALAGSHVRIRGRIQPYGGHVEEMKGRPQIIIEAPHQLTILELGSSGGAAGS